MANHSDAQGKNIIITGGASGLGAEYAEVFLKLGAKNIAILDIAEKVGEATAARLNESKPNCVIFVKCDVSDESNIQKAFDEVVDKFGRIDVLVNNAGIMNDSPAFFRTACDVNWKGLVSFTYKAIYHMSKEEGGVGGTIINISSTAALTKFPYLPTYNGTKIAVLHFTQCLAMEPFYQTTGIRLLTICFGPTDTPLLQGLEKRAYTEKRGKDFEEIIPRLNIKFQKVESAVNSFIKMFETGSPGSIWLSCKDRPVQDITSAIDNTFAELNKLII